MKVDVAIIGAGPAGVSAAIKIAENGGSVVVIDENHKVGGKLLGQLHEHPTDKTWWKGWEIAKDLYTEAQKAGVIFMKETQVWSIDEGYILQCANIFNRPNEAKEVYTKAVLIASGAVERPVPIEGWTLPGVMTVGAAQVLTNVYQVKPGKKVLIAGIDPLSFTIARQMKLAGVDVVGFVLPDPNLLNGLKAKPSEVFRELQSMSHLAPTKLLRMGGKVLKNNAGIAAAIKFYPQKGVKVWGIPLHIKKALTSIRGKNQVEGVELTNISSDGELLSNTKKEMQVDAVCLSGGLSPLGELAAIAGCKFTRMEGLGGTVPIHHKYLETTKENLFVAGNITGIEGAKVAKAQGELAGLSICFKINLGCVTHEDVERAYQKVSHTRNEADIEFFRGVREERRKMERLWENSLVSKGESV